MSRRIALSFVLCACSSFGAVTGVEILERTDLTGSTYERVIYERIVARAHFAVDPNLPANAGIADLHLAPRDEHGLVEFSADIYVLRPRDPARADGTALVEISNRGGKGLLSTFDFAQGSEDPQTRDALGDEFLLTRGFTLVWIGWEFDVPRDHAHSMHLYAPIATDHGRTITGRVRSEWIGDHVVASISLGDRFLDGYPATDLNEPDAEMFVRDTVAGARTTIARTHWLFVDSTHVSLEGGFQPGRIYELVYTAKDPVVAGLGLAAIRDFVSFLKHGGVETPLGDSARFTKRALGFGISQSGRFLRAFLYDGFNADEKGRQVFDGVWAHVAGAGRGSFNARFAQPSRDGHPFFNVLYPVDVPPFNDEDLLAKARASGTAPKIFWTNGSYEYWGRCASLIHTTQDGKADAPPASGTRIYFVTGTQHGPGHLPPAKLPARYTPNINDQRYVLRALLVDMNAWLTDGAAPPASEYPLIFRGQLVPLEALAFPKLPGVTPPEHKREAWRLDFSTEPPKMGPPYPTLVPQVDADGNEIAGIRMPLIQVPLGANTGWNLRDASIGAPDQMYSMVGSFFPFPASEIERRYTGKSGYLDKIRAAAENLAARRFLLAEDVQPIVERAATAWTLFYPEQQ